MNIKHSVNIMGLFSYVLSRLGCGALFVMMCLTVVDVVGRYVFNSPILGAFELTEYLVLITVFSFLGYTQSQKSHIAVDVLVDSFPKNVQDFVNLFNYTVSLVLIILISWKGFEKAMETLETGEISLNLSVPDYPFVFFMSFGCAVMCIELIRDIIKTFVNKQKGEKNK